MPRKQLALTKNGYETMLWTYLKRREDIRLQYKGKLMSGEYAKRICMINVKIRTFRNAIKRYEIKKEKLSNLNKVIKKWIGVDVFRLPSKIGNTENAKNKNLARKIFCKYSIEQLSLRPKDVSDYLGFSKINRTQAGKTRLEFTRTFNNIPENREMYHRFLKFIKEQQCLKKES